MTKTTLGLLCLLLVSLPALGAYTVGTYDEDLDPARITWWKSNWSSAAVELSKINAGATGVTVTIRWSPSTDLEDVYLELTFPSGFTVTDVGEYKYIESVTAGVDYEFVWEETVTNPSAAGAYGPVQLRARTWEGDQIVAINDNFAVLYIGAAEDTTTAGLSVNFVDNTTTRRVGQTGVDLKITFALADDLWKHDLVVLHLDPYYSLSASVTCTSAAASDNKFYFPGTDSTNLSDVACEAELYEPTDDEPTGSDVLYIYGLGADVDIRNDRAKSVTITIKSVTLPGSQVDSFITKLEVINFGTNWVLQTGSTTTGPSFEPGTISSASWASTWSYLTTSNFLAEMQFYVDVSITIVNAIPEDGEIQVDFLDDSLVESDYHGADDSCYLITNLLGATCSADASSDVVTIDLPNGLAAGSSIKFTVLVLLGNDATLAFEVDTFDESDNLIDSGSATATSSADTSRNIHLDNFDMYLDNVGLTANPDNNQAGPLDDNTQYIWWFVDGIAAGDLDSGTDFTINFPVSTSSKSDDQFFLLKNDDLDAYSTSTTTGGAPASPAAISSFTLTSGKDNGSFAYSLTADSSAEELWIGLNRAANDPIYNPLVASNAQTRYQAFITISDANSKTYYGVVQFEILPAAWASLDFDTLNTYDVAGMPAAVYIEVGELDFPPLSGTSGRTYYVDFTFTGFDDYLGSGAEDGDDYDCYIDVGTDSNTVCTISEDVLTVKGVTLDTDANPVDELYVYFSIGTPTAAPTIKVTGYYTLTSDVNQLKYVTYESELDDASTWTPDTSVTAAADVEVNSGNDLALNTVYSSNSRLNIGHELVLDDTDEEAIAIIAHGDFEFGSASVTLSASGGSPSDASISGANAFYFNTPNWATVLIVEGTDVDLFADGLDTLKVSGLTVPGYEETFTLSTVLGVYPLDSTVLNDGVDSSNQSDNYGEDNFDTVHGTISTSNLEVTPRSIAQRNPTGVTTDVTVKFKVTNAIPVGGKIVLEFNDSLWGYVDDDVNVDLITYSSITDESVDDPVTITHSNGVITITQFAKINAGTSISVTIPRLLPPVDDVASPGVAFVVSLETYYDTSDDYLIDEADVSGSNNKVVVTESTVAVGTSTSTLTSIPPNAGLTSPVDLYISFSFNRNIPKGGHFIVTINGSIDLNYDSGDLSDVCWLRGIRYTSCEVESNGVEVYLDEDYTSGNTLELYIEEGVKNPTTATAISSAWAFTAYYGSFKIIDDATRSPVYSYTAPAAVTGTITAGTTGISVDIKNASEEAVYTFTFRSSVALAVGDQIWIVFPNKYDHYLGGAMELFESEENTFYLPCVSALIDLNVCKVDRRHVVVDVAVARDANTEVTVVLAGVKNPEVATTGQFKIYHGSSSGIVAANQSFGTVTLSGNVDNLIHIKSVSVDDDELFSVDSDIELEFYILSDTLVDTDAVAVAFPRQWDLEYAAGDSVECDSTIFDESSTASSTATDVTWVDANSCGVDDSHVVLQLATGDGKAFSSYNDKITVTLKNIDNPEWSYDDEEYGTWDFEITDAETYDIYEYWTDKFEVYVLDAANKEYTSRSYPETNAAYLGFDDAGHQLFVQGFTSFDEIEDDFDEDAELGAYDPRTWSNRIIVFPGTQTEDLHIVTESSLLPLASKSLTLGYQVLEHVSEDVTTDDLTLSSEDDFTFFEREHAITFRVSADINASLGLYVIDWSITEEVLQTGVSEAQYQPPVKTLVEIAEKTANVYDFAFGDFPTIYEGETSMFIPVYLDHAPDTDVTLTISVAVKTTGDQSSLIEIEPNTLTFKPDVHERFFRITVDGDYNVSELSETLQFEVGGTDKFAYADPDDINFTVRTGSSPKGSITSFNVDDDDYPVTINPKASQIGILFFYVTATGNERLSEDDLEAVFDDFLSNVDDDEEDAEDVVDEEGVEQGEEESWAEYQERIYIAHLQNEYYGILFADVNGNTEQVELDFLWGNTNYYIDGYLVTGSAVSDQIVTEEYFSTTLWSNPAIVTISIDGDATSEDSQEDLVNKAALLMGINPTRVDVEVELDTTRRLQDKTSTATLYVLQDRSVSSPLPADYLNTLVDQRQAYDALLTTLVVTSISEPDELDSRVAVWTDVPEVTGETENSLTVQFLANIEGTVVCIADESDDKPSALQVFSGLNAANEVVDSKSVETDLTKDVNELTITGLDAGTSYTVWCVASDDLPLWPTLQAEAASDQGTTLSVDVEEDGSSASYISSLLILLVAFLLN